MTAQDATVDELLTGRQNLVMVGRLCGLRRADARARADELLAQFDLTDAADRVLNGYSGGMRRRLDLAAGLVTRPPVLFLDEPTTGLDPTSRVRMWDVIRGLVADGVTLLLTTQYLDEADELADRIVVIDHGRVIAEGTSAELKAATGGARLEVTLSEPHADAAAAPRALRVRPGPREPRRTPAAGAGAQRRRAWPPRWCAPSTPPASASTTSRSTSRRSTTCSSRSPAIPASPTTRRDADEERPVPSVEAADS